VELKSLQNHGTNAPTLGGGGHHEGATELDNPTELPLYPCGSHHVSLFCLSHSSLASATPAAGSRAAGDGGHGERSFVEPLSSPGGFRHHPPHPHPHQSAPPPPTPPILLLCTIVAFLLGASTPSSQPPKQARAVT
jgi:hypothetical protein